MCGDACQGEKALVGGLGTCAPVVTARRVLKSPRELLRLRCGAKYVAKLFTRICHILTSMTSEPTPKKQKPRLNPRMLRWARIWRGRTLEEAAACVKKAVADIERWETPIDDMEAWVRKGPTVKQARDLADLYERSFLEFFRTDPPMLTEPELVPDYRMQKGIETDASDTRELKQIQAWAEEKRTNALDLIDDLAEQPPRVPDELFVKLPVSSEDAAENARSVLKFPISDQFAIKSQDRYKFPNILRRVFEGRGILVLRRSDLTHYGARGMCIFATPMPIIVFGNEPPGAQAFTLAHELGHVALKQSAISGPRVRNNPFDVEDWCDQFSAAFLMPRDALRGVLGQPPSQPAARFDDLQLSQIANRFSVSQHAMLIRLVHLKYVHPNYYWSVKKPQFDKQEAEYKSKARAKYYGSRYNASVGDLYTGLVLEAWNLGRITNHNAAEFMGIKNFQHLYDIRDNFGT